MNALPGGGGERVKEMWKGDVHLGGQVIGRTVSAVKAKQGVSEERNQKKGQN